jgi:ATP-dependent phosphofructokinase / diphosphate-dependent phosphofructokinase
MSAKNLGVLVAGGPAPGINSVIAAASIRARLQGTEVIGIRDGFEWIMQGSIEEVVPLTIDTVSRIHFRGGSIIGISRANPTSTPERMQNTLQSFERLGISQLITIGGEGTAYLAAKIEEASGGAIRVVHVPKTIDNDLPLPPNINSFGYQTARHVGAGILRSLMVDAHSMSRWYFVITMGRSAGHLALGIGKAAGATLTLIPEELDKPSPLRAVVDTLVGAIVKRRAHGQRHGVAVIAEGIAAVLEEGALEGAYTRGKDGRLKLSSIRLGDILAEAVEKELLELGIETSVVSKDIGYEVRSAEPIPYDMEYTRDLGYCAARYLCEGGSGAMVTMQGGRFVPIPFADMRDPETGATRVRLVDVQAERYKIARRYMIRIRRDDFANPDLLAKLAATANMTVEQFRERFQPLTKNEPPPLTICE